MYNPFTLEGKTILITGASSGIGKRTAIECSRLGAKLILTARNEERLRDTLSSLKGDGHELIVADVSETTQIEKLVNALPLIDGLSCNAGIANTSLVNFYKEDDIKNIFRVNTFSVMLLTKFLLKKKKLKKGASVVFTASAGNVFWATPANGIYGASKCAIDGFMRTAALELAPKGIRCNCVCPTMIMSEMLGSTGSISEEQYAEDMKKYPLGRYGKPEEVAWGIIYLLSDASSFITGTSLKLDGGATL